MLLCIYLLIILMPWKKSAAEISNKPRHGRSCPNNAAAWQRHQVLFILGGEGWGCSLRNTMGLCLLLRFWTFLGSLWGLFY